MTRFLVIVEVEAPSDAEVGSWAANLDSLGEHDFEVIDYTIRAD